MSAPLHQLNDRGVPVRRPLPPLRGVALWWRVTTLGVITLFLLPQVLDTDFYYWMLRRLACDKLAMALEGTGPGGGLLAFVVACTIFYPKHTVAERLLAGVIWSLIIFIILGMILPI